MVEGDFDLDKNYIIQKHANLSELFSMFNKMSTLLQAEILSVLIGIMRKSERNLLAAVDAKIYEKALEILNETEDDVVADLLVDILTVLTALTINVHELKLFLRYLKTEHRIWVRNANIFLMKIHGFLCLEKTCSEIVTYLQKSSLSIWT